jgi:hypothetical protein
MLAALGVPPQLAVRTADMTRINVNAFIFGMILVLCSCFVNTVKTVVSKR